ncbi:MAG: prephenate dehydratase [Candidatus Dormibacteraceae bacterium]
MTEVKITSVGYQGEIGAYSQEATAALFPESAAHGYRTFRLALEALGSGEIEAAVLPVENSLGGVVQGVSDLLWETADISLQQEYVHPIIHALIGYPDTPISEAKSHPQALAQCRHWLHQNGIEPIEGYDTAGCVRELLEQPIAGRAAIASLSAAQHYGLTILEPGIQDDDSNRTRFVVVRRGVPRRPAAGRPGDLCSLAFVTTNQPGSLVHALKCFEKRSVNLTRLDSRPLGKIPFKYRFYLDIEIGDPQTAEAALTDLEDCAAEVRLFGTYPAFSERSGGKY